MNRLIILALLLAIGTTLDAQTMSHKKEKRQQKKLLQKENDAWLNTQQQEEKIVYVFPDSVEVAVYEYITQVSEYFIKRGEEVCYYLVLEKDTANVYRLIVQRYDPSYNPNHRANLSNRVAVINDKRLPLLFDYDELFGTVDAINMGRYGVRNESYVKRSITIRDWAFTIYFIGGYNQGRNYGKILKKEGR